MPLRDHFRPARKNSRQWRAFHGQWPAMIVLDLLRQLPPRYFAAPGVRIGQDFEVDIATFEEEEPLQQFEEQNGGATAVAASVKPLLTIELDSLDTDEYEVLVYDDEDDQRLVAAIEIVSPGNKDRLSHRRAFVRKCATFLKNEVCVSIVDFVTTRTVNLGREVLAELGDTDGSDSIPSLYSTTMRTLPSGDHHRLEFWEDPLALGMPLPALQLWLSETFAHRLELENSYEETCRVLRIH